MAKALNGQVSPSIPMPSITPNPQSYANALKNQEMQHSGFQPISSLQGQDPLTDWGINVAQRFQHPLEVAAGEAQRITQMSPEELAGQFGGGGMQNVGGLLAHTAWHGSPYVFDKFKSEAIGTGEGAQAFGHGLYLAENPEVAKMYRDKLTVGENYVEGQLLDPYNPRHYLASVLNESSGNVQEAADTLNSMAIRGGSKSIKDTAKQALELLEKGDTPSVQYIKPEGSLYKLDIPDTHIDRMLDWDKPLSQQHPDVQEALKNLGIEPKQTNFYGITPSGEWGITRSGMSDIPGDDIYRMLQDQHGHSAASAKLLEQGIPGIKYLDQGSRTAGEGSRNFVMFNPEDIRILERNSVPTGQVPWGQK